MAGITFGIDADYGGYKSIAELVREFSEKWPDQYCPIDATIEILGKHMALPVPEEVYSQLYAPTDPDAPHPVRGFRPLEEIETNEAAWRRKLKEEMKTLAERL